MKKIRLLGLISLFVLSLAITSNASAETLSTEQESSTPQTTETMTTDSSTESSPEESETTESSTSEIPSPDPDDTPITEPPATPTIVEKDLSSEITAYHEKGDKISAISFQVGIESSLNKKLTNYRFETGEDFIAETVGIHVAKVLADLDEQTTYLITCSYSVQNNVSTIPEPELTYDAKNHILKGKTLPNHLVAFYKVGLGTGEEIEEINTIADENGDFSISADKFERGRLMAAVVHSPDGLEFSTGTQFKIPLVAITEPTTEPSDSSSTQPSQSNKDSTKPKSSTSTKPKAANNKKLPATGEENNPWLPIVGLLALIGGFSLFLVKKKVNE